MKRKATEKRVLGREEPAEIVIRRAEECSKASGGVESAKRALASLRDQVFSAARAGGTLVLSDRAESRQCYGDGVWPTDAHALDEEASITLRHCFVRAPRWLVNG